MQSKTLHRRKGTIQSLDELGLLGVLEDGAGFVGIGANLRSDLNRWVLKKFSKDTFDGFADYVEDIKQKLQHMYVCVPHVRKSTNHRDRNLLGK